MPDRGIQTAEMRRAAERQRDTRILSVIREVSTLGGEPYQSATEGQIGYRKPVQEDTAPMLAAITAARKPKRMLEFGTAYGLSGLQLLRGNPDARLVTIEFEQPESECYDPCYANHKHNYPKGVSKAINEPESGQCNCECHFDTWGSSGLLKWDQTPEEKRIRSCSHCQDKEEGYQRS